MDKLINQLLRHNKVLALVIVGFIGCLNSAKAVELKIIGNVIKGTCVVEASNMEVKFPQTLFVSDIKTAIDDKTFVKPFSLKYSCSEFDLTTGPAPYLMRVTAANGTSIDPSNKIYPTVNVTNAAFVLKSCDTNKNNCHIVDINNGGVIPFEVTSNSNSENHFEVSVIQLGVDTPVPGELMAAVDITLLQP